MVLGGASAGDESLGDYLTLVGTGIGALAAGLALAAAVAGWYRRTLGRRRDRYDRLARLGPGAQLSFFVSVLGEPPAISRTIEAEATQYVGPGDPLYDSTTVPPGFETHSVRARSAYTESFFIDRDYYVQTLTDADDTVLAFSVTTRSRLFAPTFTGVAVPPRFRRIRWWLAWRLSRLRRRRGDEEPEVEAEMGDAAGSDDTFSDGTNLDDDFDPLEDEELVDEDDGEEPEKAAYHYEPLFKVRLGRTRFSEISRGEHGPRQAEGSCWPRGFSYSEVHYFGNPGFYLNYVFTASMVAGWAPIGSFDFAGRGLFKWPPDEPEAVDGDEVDVDWPDWNSLSKVHRFRRESVVTTYSVIGNLLVDDYPTSYGPHGDEVRTLP